MRSGIAGTRVAVIMRGMDWGAPSGMDPFLGRLAADEDEQARDHQAAHEPEREAAARPAAQPGVGRMHHGMFLLRRASACPGHADLGGHWPSPAPGSDPVALGFECVHDGSTIHIPPDRLESSRCRPRARGHGALPYAARPGPDLLGDQFLDPVSRTIVVMMQHRIVVPVQDRIVEVARRLFDHLAGETDIDLGLAPTDAINPPR